MISLFRGTYAFLSNFFDYCPVMYDFLVYRNSEAAYQAAKAADQQDKQRFCDVTPGLAKAMGKSIKIRPDWDEVKADIMKEIVQAKFRQHPELAANLVATGDEELVEGNFWHDNFFGSCQCPTCRDEPGQNVLGKILMDERDYHKNVRKIIYGQNTKN